MKKKGLVQKDLVSLLKKNLVLLVLLVINVPLGTDQKGPSEVESVLLEDYDAHISFRGSPTWSNTEGIRVPLLKEYLHLFYKSMDLYHPVSIKDSFIPVLLKTFATSKWCTLRYFCSYSSKDVIRISPQMLIIYLRIVTFRNLASFISSWSH